MTRPVITLLGDSISAGYGLRASDALPVRLQAALVSRGLDAEVIGAGRTGDAVRDGLARLDQSVPERTDLCIIALGANDMMQAVPPAHIRAGLDAMIFRLLARPTRVLLCGLRAPPWLGAYATAFNAVFPAVAQAHRVAFHPFLLEGVALDPKLNLPDRIHPNARGIEIIAEAMSSRVMAALGACGAT